MKLTLNPEKTILTTSDPARPTLVVSCIVRERHGQDVVRTMPSQQAYKPQVFPKGVWKVAKPVAKTDPYTAPWFIPTNAWQNVEVWSEDDHGIYGQPTGKMVRDEGYGLHNSTSRTTLGCIKIEKKTDLAWLVEVLAKEDVTLEVL